jgi:hypothetical protein
MRICTSLNASVYPFPENDENYDVNIREIASRFLFLVVSKVFFDDVDLLLWRMF